MITVRILVLSCALACVSGAVLTSPGAAAKPTDPGVQTTAVRGTAQSACPGSTMQPFDPAPIAGLTPAQLSLFCAGLKEFRTADEVKDGLGPTMNFNSCVGCHAYPAAGGSSPPPPNPQWAFGKSYPPGTNHTPSFITQDGPVREARFIRNADGTPDGGVHALFTITGLTGASGCSLKQPDFDKEFKGINKPGNNVIFRIPTPVFGAGLMEQIEDQTLVRNLEDSGRKAYRGVARMAAGRLNVIRAGHAHGTENRNGNDGTIARFGWKAQNKSLLVFSGEAYNVEMGISNELFQTERNEQPECQFHTVPNDVTNPEKLAAASADDRLDALSDVEKFAAFMRFLAPPTPAADKPGGAASIKRGRDTFGDIGCDFCHTPELRTAAKSTVAALADKPVRLWSDLALHQMGPNLADSISQGQAGPGEFRTAPLWGLGQRTHFLHDGRTGNLVDAIEEHYSKSASGLHASDANPVVKRYRELSDSEKQDLLNFLRSL
jgi:CxxC motif-containing protein (DUF1111 family)